MSAVLANDMASFELRYSVKYNTKNPVPIDEVIASLQSLSIMLKDTYHIVEDLVHVDLYGQKIYIEKIETGSLINDIVLLFQGDKDTISKIIKWFEEHKMKSLLVGMIAGAVVLKGYQVLTSPNVNAAAGSTVINNSGVLVINTNDNVSKETQEQVNKAIEKNIEKQNYKTFASTVLDFISPIRSEPEATISMSSNGNVVAEVPTGVVSSIPTVFEAKKNQRFEKVSNVKVDFRAIDLDSRKRGWGGTITGIVDKRVSIVLDPTLDPIELNGKTSVIADVEIERTFQKTANQMMPTKIIIRAIH